MGIIPAHAGLTPTVGREVDKEGDHPRACGAHCLIALYAALALGSSPRMRGSQDHVLHESALGGIIPAHAGLTQLSRKCHWQGRDHPRACGAHYNGLRVGEVVGGSSPRMRGSHDIENATHNMWGIIPAHAGLTGPLQGCGRIHRDHPRACGAHLSAAAKTTVVLGSSPRMRGSLACAGIKSARRGIIPAHAGLTEWVVIILVIKWDHPRACGAHTSPFDDLS